MILNTVIYDIETLRNFYLYMDINYKTRTITVYKIGAGHNDLVAICKYLRYGKLNQVGFNNLKFDSQVNQFILQNEEYWVKHKFTGDEIAGEIYQYVKKIIGYQNTNTWPDYPEWKLVCPQLDLYTVWHFNNRAKMTSLKWVQFSMNWPNLQDMPIDHDSIITPDQVDMVVSYCLNDIMSTLQFFDYTMGRCQHPEYKGKDKLQLRKNIKEKFKIKCLNYNDVKIGDELNKMSYMELANVDKYELKNLKAPTNDFKFGDCIPHYVTFKTEELQNFYNLVKEITVDLNSKQNQKLKFRGTSYIIAKGGIHSEDKPRIVVPQPYQILRDADIGLKIVLWSN